MNNSCGRGYRPRRTGRLPVQQMSVLRPRTKRAHRGRLPWRRARHSARESSPATRRLDRWLQRTPASPRSSPADGMPQRPTRPSSAYPITGYGIGAQPRPTGALMLDRRLIRLANAAPCRASPGIGQGQCHPRSRSISRKRPWPLYNSHGKVPVRPHSNGLPPQPGDEKSRAHMASASSKQPIASTVLPSRP